MMMLDIVLPGTMYAFMLAFQQYTLVTFLHRKRSQHLRLHSIFSSTECDCKIGFNLWIRIINFKWIVVVFHFKSPVIKIRYLVGSSSNITGGSLTSSSPIASLFFWPPDRFTARVFLDRCNPRALMISSTCNLYNILGASFIDTKMYCTELDDTELLK